MSEMVDICGVHMIRDGDMVAKRHKSRGEFEPRSMELWRELARERGIMIDVGAYTGIYSIAAEQEGSRAIAIEPMQECARRMIKNAGLNRVDISHVYHNGASDRSGPSHMWTRGGLSSASKVSAEGREIELMRIDDIPIDGRVVAIKIDVEGHEIPVIRGARETIAKHRPTIIVECWSETDFLAVAKILPDYVGAKLEWSNYVFVPRSVSDDWAEFDTAMEAVGR